MTTRVTLMVPGRVRPDERLIANARLLLVTTPSRRLGIESLVAKAVRLGARRGRATQGQGAHADPRDCRRRVLEQRCPSL